MSARYQLIQNGGMVPRREIPTLSGDHFVDELLTGIEEGWRVVSYFGAAEGELLKLYCLLSYKIDGTLGVISTVVGSNSFPSLVEKAPQLHLFEREIAEQFGIHFAGHPWLKPLRFAPPLGSPSGVPPKRPNEIGIMDFYKVEGEEVHEVAVGPVHAGIIEPGHFRFQCFGEEVMHLEISLGYQHRGVERSILGAPSALTRKRLETTAGDTTIGHVS
jgi:hypothetical protein